MRDRTLTFAMWLYALAGGALAAIGLFAYAPMIWFGAFDPYLGMLLSLLAFLVLAPLATLMLIGMKNQNGG